MNDDFLLIGSLHELNPLAFEKLRDRIYYSYAVPFFKLDKL